MKQRLGLAASAAVVATGCAANAASDLRITIYDSAKPAAQVRACLLKTVQTLAPSVEAFSRAPTNDAWVITFRHAGGPASIVVNARPGGARVLYPSQIARADARLAQALEDCG